MKKLNMLEFVQKTGYFKSSDRTHEIAFPGGYIATAINHPTAPMLERIVFGGKSYSNLQYAFSAAYNLYKAQHNDNCDNSAK
ncbi:hypothetical protein [Serratia phage vB_SmaS_Opt-169]|nr:hypothetical protein [Serratia phage vB_SmaS_Opt-169]